MHYKYLSPPPKIVSTTALPVVHGLNEPVKAEGQVADAKKRMFLRMAGIGGAGLIMSALMPKKAEALVMGGTPSAGVVGIKDSTNLRIDPATETTLAAKASEATLATRASETTLLAVKANSDKFTFDGSGKLLTASSGAGSAVTVNDTTATQINPATEDSTILLRRIIRQVDSLGVVDSAQRQKITIDSITGSLTLSTVTTVGTVSTVTSATNLVALGGVDGRYLHIDTARNAYANGVRNNLIWS